MECKCKFAKGYFRFCRRINRYIMECKSKFYPALKCGLPELIDTLWNVNLGQVLEKYDLAKRINRYIMECKCAFAKSAFPADVRINRYIMECKCGSTDISKISTTSN